MALRIPALLLLAFLNLTAAGKKAAVASARGENQDIVITATIYADPESIKGQVGDELGGHYIIASVKVEPKYTKEVVIDRDDFQLRTDKDGEKSKPFAPSQIAGRGALVISQTTTSGNGVMGDESGPIGGGMPGSMGGPMRLPGSGGAFGNGGGGDATGASAQMNTGSKEKVSPLLKVLEEKILAEGKTDQPRSGLLYFVMEKQKIKDLELTYGGRENRITMRFKP